MISSVFFFIGIFCLSLIVWVIQAVNYLDFVSEDGHSFKVYLYYTFLSFPKIFSRLLLFIFFISVFYTILRYEEKNELIILWTNGIKKKSFLNFVIKISFLLIVIQIILNAFIVPKSQDIARSYIRSSNIDYFPSLLKSKKFINAVEGLTIFIDKKNDKGRLENIFLKEGDAEFSQIILAKQGLLKRVNKDYYLELYNGSIIDRSSNSTNLITFDKTKFNLSNFTTKTTIAPKIQEQSTGLLIKCIRNFYKYDMEFIERNLNCNKNSISVVNEEIYKRLIVPFYILIVSLVGSCLALKSELENNFNVHKILVFFAGMIFIILSQILSKYSSEFVLKNISILIMPFLVSLIFYLFIQFKLKE